MEVLLCLLGALLIQQASGQGVSLELNGNFVENFGLLEHNDIDTSDVLEDLGSNLVCRTDLTTCCRNSDGLAQGRWYYPTGDNVLFNFEGSLPDGQIYRFRRGAQVVRIRRDPNVNIASTANGIYRCELADQNGVTQTRYVGLYTEGAGAGVVSISEDPQFSLISEDPLEFTLTSTTTGGPPTTAFWTLPNSATASGDQELLTGVNAFVRHTLTVTERLTGEYMFSTTNARSGPPITRSITVQAANPPTGLMAVQSALANIQISWTAPAPGSVPRTSYRISYQTGGGSVQSVDVGPTATSHTLITGLQSGATYSISIVALSSTLPSTVVGPEMVTFRAFEAPAVMTSVLSPTSIRVTFTQPSGNLAAESYDIQYTRVTGAGQTLCANVEDTGATTGVQSPFTITTLEEFSSYDVTVTARVFVVMRTTTEQAMTSPAVPAAAPRDLVSTTVLSTSIAVGWNTVVCIERNGVIVNYIVRFGPEGGVQSDSTVQSGGISVAGTYTASGLTPFTSYSFEVAAVNSVDTGPFTATLLVVTDEDEPGLVDSLRSSTFTTSITITWSEPQAPNGIITRYEVQYSPQSDPTDTTTVNVTLSRTFTLSNLEPGTTFTFQVTAFTRIGRGPSETLTASAVMRLTPDPPVVTLGVVTATTVTLSWSPQSGVGQYEVRYVRAVGSQQHGACPDFVDTPNTEATTENSLTVAGLQEFSTYTVTVFAVNNAGRVPSEEIVIMTPEAAPAPPRGLEVANFTHTAITVHWEPLECIDINSQFEITGYAVQYGFASEPGTSMAFQSSLTIVTIKILTPGVEYFIEVAAVNSNGETGEYNRIIQTTSGGGSETATIAAASVVVVLVVLILALSGVVITVLVLKHRRAAPPLTQQPPTTEGVVLTTFSDTTKPPAAISTGPNAAYQTVASGGRGQRQGNDGDHAYEYIVPPTQQSHDQPELPHIYEST